MSLTRLYPKDKVRHMKNNFFEGQRVWIMIDDNTFEHSALIERVEKRGRLNTVFYHVIMEYSMHQNWISRFLFGRAAYERRIVTEAELFPYVPRWELALNRVGIYVDK